ncbi:MAG: TonB-dependent receptor [Tannerella sp.]|jgi:outer membrane cobalamin receptor|nr:TonB-dependent receptor [Tannerella sp.]
MRISAVLTLLFVCHSAVCQFNISGRVLEEKTKQAVEYAAVVVAERELWAVTDDKGAFAIKNVAKGEVKISVSCLGYAKKIFTVKVDKTLTELEFLLPEDNLALNEVVVTAKSGSEAATSYSIDRKGLDHLQMLGVGDVMSLLPGGQTNRATHLATSSPQRLALRGTTGEHGNSTFGTAIEVDGVRLSNNTSFVSGDSKGEVYGVDTRNIATHNIESVEIVTGIPSVEYGDLTNGIVKINSRRGKSPLNVEMSTKPNTKQASFSKGFDLIGNVGILNISAEYVKSVNDLSSPYTSYKRNNVTLLYEKSLNITGLPFTITGGLTGNIGGYNSGADPDSFKETYLKQSDNTVRGHFKLDRLLNKSWITGIEISGSASYSDNQESEKVNKSSSSAVASIHGREEGYFVAHQYDEQPDAPIVMIPAGYWYQLSKTDNRPLAVAAKIKAKWSRKFGKINSNMMLGVDYKGELNKGRGLYYDDMRYAPTWREYRYDEVPMMNNISLYGEENISAELGGGTLLKLTAGLRSDITTVKGSQYGTVNSLSPRFNAKIIHRNMSLHAGWGRAVKLPAFAVLYPAPSYSDKLSFAPGTMADGTIFYAYHIQPYKTEYNPSLQWQKSHQAEIGLEYRHGEMNFSINFWRNRMIGSYSKLNKYTPFEYKFTDPRMLESSVIEPINRRYSIDRTTGIVTVGDRTGQHPDETLGYKEMRTFKTTNSFINGSPSTQSGIDWIASLGKLHIIGTSVRIDGSYYHYKGLDETLNAWSSTGQMMADNNPYKYIGYYVGGNSSSNGSETKQLNSNITFTTHIPAIRLIFSLRIEATLYDYTRNLSEYADGSPRGFILDAREDYFPSSGSYSGIYNQDRYVGFYPLYYTMYEDTDTRIPFAEKFLWARDNDRSLYNELAKLVVKTNTDYYFNDNRLSAYWSANINITKEMGDRASISFQARNFLNNLQTVTSSNRNSTVSVYRTSYIPTFYYGLSLTVKL